MSDQDSSKEKLHHVILEGLGSHDLRDAWDKFKTRLEREEFVFDEERARGRDIIVALQGKSIEGELWNIINLCSDTDNGLVLLKRACSIFRSTICRRNAEMILRDIAKNLMNQPAFNQDETFLNIPSEVDLTWVDQLDATACAKASRIVQELSRVGEPFYDNKVVEQLLLSQPPQPQEIKILLKQLLESRAPDVVDQFRARLTSADLETPNSQSVHYLFIIVEENPNRESEYFYKAELHGSQLPAFTDSQLARETNGTWTKGSKEQLLPYVLRMFAAANSIAVCKLNVEVFLPTRLLSVLSYDDLNESIERMQADGELSTRTKNLAFTCPYVLRSLERARRAPQKRLGPLVRKWQALDQSAAIIHDLDDISRLQRNSFESKLSQDATVGFIMLSDLPKYRASLFEQIINYGVAIFAWWQHHANDDDAKYLPGDAASRLELIDQALGLNGPKRNNQGEIIAPAHLCNTEFTAYQRFRLAGNGHCDHWVDRLMILHDHPLRWPRSLAIEQEEGGRMQSLY